MSDGVDTPASEGRPTTAGDAGVPTGHHVAAATDVVPDPASGVVPAGLGRWMAGQRWYASKGLAPRLRVLGAVEDTVDGVRIATYLLLDEAPEAAVLYQVPLTVRSAPVDDLDTALVGAGEGSWVYDGPHDVAYARWLVRTMSDGTSVAGTAAAPAVDGAVTTLAGHALVDPGTIEHARVLRGEQSNTSIICDAVDGPTAQVIVKVFRVLHHGDNPDVTSQAAISQGGSTRVPTSFGSVRGTWPDPGREDGTADGDLAFAQEFLAGSEDAWRVALRAAADGTAFVSEARALGAAVADVHRTLARQLPTVAAGASEIAEAVDSMRSRLDLAAREVPAVAEHAQAIGRVYDAAAAASWPDLQRIHGDLHLGQAVLAAGDRGWVLLDFEGEPLRPMPERSRPDVTLRDVAGMLRSFDYVGGALQHEEPPVAIGTWADDARAAFLAGYAEAMGVDVHAQQTLLAAFELDKAVYEAVYEARNRPDWIAIPVTAVQRLATAAE